MEEKCIEYEQQIRLLREETADLEKSWKAKHETQLSQINVLNKDRIKNEREIESSKKEYSTNLDENKKLKSQVQKQMEEIQRMNEYITQMETYKNLNKSNENSEENSNADEIRDLKYKNEQMYSELQDKDQKYIQLMERLRQTQNEFKQYQSTHPEDMTNLISKDEHMGAMAQLKQINQELMAEIKKLHQTIEKQKAEDSKLRKVIASNSNTPTHQQLLIIKEFTDISKRISEYDDSGLLQRNEAQVIDVVDSVLKDYDNLTNRYHQLEKELIKTKLQYAEAEELKERAIVELDTVMGNNNISKSDKSVCLTDEDNMIENKPINENSSGSIFSKATNLFSSASTFYSGRFGNNS